MDDILTDSETLIMRKVRDIDHMILCDGYQYAIVTYRGNDQLVRRTRSGVTWRFVTDLEATIKEDKEREKAFEAEQEMQALQPGLELKAWNACQVEDIDPRNQEEEEEFGTPNAAYCQSMEVDHNGGWFCYHPSCVTSPCEV